MASNFYNSSGLMVGVDFHKYMIPVPPLVIPAHPHVVFSSLGRPLDDEKKRVQTVTSEQQPMMQKAAALAHVPHIPIPVPPPSPAEFAELAWIHASASSSPALGAGAVTGQGAPLAVCTVGGFGLDLNCQEIGMKLPTGIVIQFNSVTTSPTLADYVDALIDLAIDTVIGWLSKLIADRAVKFVQRYFKERLTELCKRVLKFIYKGTFKEIFKDIAKPTQKRIKKTIRDLL